MCLLSPFFLFSCFLVDNLRRRYSMPLGFIFYCFCFRFPGQKASSVTPNNSDGAANSASACSNAKATDNAPSHNKAMWIFTEEELQNSPSRKCGIAVEAENLHRKKAVKYIRTIGQRLNLYVNFCNCLFFAYYFFCLGFLQFASCFCLHLDMICVLL